MIYNDNCLAVLSTLPENSIDAILTDPPYGLSDHKPVDVEECLTAWLKGEPFLTKKKGFLDNSWDGWVPGPEIWKECLRVLKPGGFMLAFAGCRTLDLMSLAIRLGGFRIHPQLAWLYGSGMPKGSNLSKQFDKGHERPVAYERKLHGGKHLLDTWHNGPQCSIYSETLPVTDEAKEWNGWYYGLAALKPAMEPIVMAQKPIEGRMVDNIRKWGCGALNIKACKIPLDKDAISKLNLKQRTNKPSGKSLYFDHGAARIPVNIDTYKTDGRWPANVLHDGSDDVLEVFPESKSTDGKHTKGHDGQMRMGRTSGDGANSGGLGDSGSTARFFYCAKASKAEKGETNHPCTKPLALLQYLATLITPPGGVILDPFMGSGSTCVAAKELGFQYLGVELDPKYFEMAKKTTKLRLFLRKFLEFSQK